MTAILVTTFIFLNKDYRNLIQISLPPWWSLLGLRSWCHIFLFKSMQLNWRISSAGAPSPNELHRFDCMIGYQDSNPSNGHHVTCPIITQDFWSGPYFTSMMWSCCKLLANGSTGGHFKNAFELVNLGVLKFTALYKNCIFQYMG